VDLMRFGQSCQGHCPRMVDVAAAGWQESEPVQHGGGLTLLAGSTFLLCDANGDLSQEPQGFFLGDRRVLSRLELRVDGAVLEPLRTMRTSESSARVLKRAAVEHGTVSSQALLVATDLDVSPSELVIRLALRNGGRDVQHVRWVLRAASDFADIFAVKDGTARGRDMLVEAELVTHHMLTISGPNGLHTDLHLREGRFDPIPSGVREVVDIPPGSTVERVVAVVAGSASGPLGEPVSLHVRGLRRPQLATRGTALTTAVKQGLDDLTALRVHDHLTGGATLAAGAPWFMTLFGRDSLISGIMAAAWDQQLGLDVLTSLAARQGRQVDPLSEEEPGRILHESRLSTGTPLFPGHRTLYFGSTDATPLFVVLLGELVENGLEVDAAARLLPNADACLAWLEHYGDLDGDGFAESVARSPSGLVNQGWKDSWNAIVDELGDVVRPPVCLIEVQAYWYAALRARAVLARVVEGRSGATWDARADALRAHVDDAFWLPDLDTYALALDGDKRPLRTSTSNAGHMLWTGCALPGRVASLGATLMHRQLRSHWGLRTLATDNPAFDPLGYHTGSVWPHDTALVAWGLSRWGLGRAAQEFVTALVRASSHFDGALPELLAGFDVSDEVGGGAPVRFPTACSPQAWAAASPLLLVRVMLGLDVDVPGRRVHVAPHIPEEWLPLTLHGVRIGGAPVVLRATHGNVRLDGLPPEYELVHSARWGR
jgi:glycogen debranching enzyme